MGVNKTPSSVHDGDTLDGNARTTQDGDDSSGNESAAERSGDLAMHLSPVEEPVVNVPHPTAASNASPVQNEREAAVAGNPSLTEDGTDKDLEHSERAEGNSCDASGNICDIYLGRTPAKPTATQGDTSSLDYAMSEPHSVVETQASTLNYVLVRSVACLLASALLSSTRRAVRGARSAVTITGKAPGDVPRSRTDSRKKNKEKTRRRRTERKNKVSAAQKSAQEDLSSGMGMSGHFAVFLKALKWLMPRFGRGQVEVMQSATTQVRQPGYPGWRVKRRLPRIKLITTAPICDIHCSVRMWPPSR